MNRKIINNFIFCLLIAGICFFATSAQAESQNTGILLTIHSAIGPATEEYITQGLQTATKQNASVVILEIDTPGGLDTSMRGIVQAILASSIPIVAYVSPSGARAASAGTYILYASHIAAMAPATNLGAATPVQLLNDETQKSTLQKKSTNDAVAYIKSLAELRHRNINWATQSVTSSASISAEEALKTNVIDLIADNVPELLTAINGKSVTIHNQIYILHTDNIVMQNIQPNWRSKILAIITDPSIAYILLLIGIYGLFFEFAHPGFVLPGVVGAIALIFASYALNMLPISYAGLSLIILGLIFLIAEAFVPSFGALGFGGIIAFIIGSIFLMNTDDSAYHIDLSLIITMAVINALFFLGIVGMAIRSRQRKIVSGREALLNSQGIALENFEKEGWILVNGERWQAISSTPIKQHQAVRVSEIKGLKLVINAIQ